MSRVFLTVVCCEGFTEQTDTQKFSPNICSVFTGFKEKRVMINAFNPSMFPSSATCDAPAVPLDWRFFNAEFAFRGSCLHCTTRMYRQLSSVSFKLEKHLELEDSQASSGVLRIIFMFRLLCVMDFRLRCP